MEINKLLAMIGLTKKAGQLLEGNDRVVEAAWRGKVRLILLAEDLSPASIRRVQQSAHDASIPWVVVPITMDQIRERTGRSAGVLGITDSGFAKGIEKLLAQK